MTAIWPDARVDELKRRWHAGESMGDIARALGTTRNAIIGKSNRLNLQFHGHEPSPIPSGSDADVYATTRFRSQVKVPPSSGILKPGSYQRKLGSHVLKGRWKGMPLFSISLEERATCPRSCKMWLGCYGNASPKSIRYAHGPQLLTSIRNYLTILQRKHPDGFVVRCHQLGDFFSVEYVDFWRASLDEFPALRVFGYTARNYIGKLASARDPIAVAIEALRDERWDRFAVRTSGAYTGPRTVVVKDASSKTPAVICPAQTVKHKEIWCGRCALCWNRSIPAIAFMEH